MALLEGLALLLVIAVATAVVLTRDPLHQAIVVSLYGLVLAVLFLLLQAPDVALSEIAVGAVAVPLMILLALAKSKEYAIHHHGKDPTKEEPEEEAADEPAQELGAEVEGG